MLTPTVTEIPRACAMPLQAGRMPSQRALVLASLLAVPESREEVRVS